MNTNEKYNVIQCPNCQSRLKVRPELHGKKAKCPKCSEVFVLTIPQDQIENIAESVLDKGEQREYSNTQTKEQRSPQNFHNDQNKLQKLQSIARFPRYRKEVVSGTIVSFVLGIIFMIIGLYAVSNDRSIFLNALIRPGKIVVLDFIMVFTGLIGLFLIVKGIVTLVTKRPVVVILGGISSLLFFLWWILVALHSLVQGSLEFLRQSPPVSLNMGPVDASICCFLAFVSLGRAFSKFSRYPHYKACWKAISDVALYDEVRHVTLDVLNGNPKSRSDMIEIKTRYVTWKAWLGDSYTAFTGIRKRFWGSYRDWLFLDKNDVTVTSKGKKAVTGKKLKVHIKLGKLSQKGIIKSEHMDRFNVWKNNKAIIRNNEEG